MLKKRQTTVVHGECMIGELAIAGYSAELNSANPERVQFSYWINNPNMYKEHRVEARADQAAFEDAVYLLQDEMLAALQTTEPTE